MKKILIIAAVLAAGAVYFFNFRHSVYGNEIKTVILNNRKIRAEVVSSEAKRMEGLSGRDKICGECGMLFVFPREGDYPFWMKDMRFDLDIIWIAGDKIADIQKRVLHEGGENNVIDPQAKADKVLELNSGMADELGLQVGDRVKI